MFLYIIAHTCCAVLIQNSSNPVVIFLVESDLHVNIKSRQKACKFNYSENPLSRATIKFKELSAQILLNIIKLIISLIDFPKSLSFLSKIRLKAFLALN